MRMFRLLAVTALSIATGPMWSCARTTTSGEWRSYASDPASTKYPPLGVTATNVAGLRLVWRWKSSDESLRVNDARLWTWKNGATPLMAGGVLFYVAPSLSRVAAIGPDMRADEVDLRPRNAQGRLTPGMGFVHRGVTLWEDGGGSPNPHGDR